jgi:starch-binding outer membrane protein, SusD/RagB family
VLLVGCKDWLTGDKLTNNPNKPTDATAEQLFTGVEVSIMSLWETYPMNLLPLWAQQIVGVTRQWADYANYLSGTDNITADGLWNQMYGGGGLADARRIDSLTTANGDIVLRGEGRVLQALIVGTAADIWGDIPFSQAGFADIKTPQFDTQADVYAHIEALLDSAIADMASGQGDGALTADVIYANDVAKWTAAAHTLKARFYMHTSRGADSTARFTAALAEAQLGIRTATGGLQISSPAYDFQSVHTTTAGEQNLFYNFLIGPRAGDVEPSAIHITALDSTANDSLLPVFYISNDPTGAFIGSSAGVSAGGTVATFAITATTPMGIVTYAENELILAEAQYRLGDQAGALATLNAFRASVGAPAAAVPGVTNGLLVAILLEKYGRLFLNPEVYFDYLRTCVPNIPAPVGASADFPYVPARLPYGYTEEITNPDPHIPNQPGNLANANFPKNLTDPTGATCIGQANRPGP